jgi:hypothetical protein
LTGTSSGFQGIEKLNFYATSYLQEYLEARTCSRQEFEFHSTISFRPEQVPVSGERKRELVRAKGLNFTANAISDRNKFWFPGCVKYQIY